MRKRGELTSATIIPILIIIASFTVILLFLFSNDFSSYAEDDVCKLSVLTRATSPQEFQSGLPLKCNTKKICLTSRFFGGDCDSFAGEKDVKKFRIDKADDLSKVAAEEMYSCWNMMGQGKLDLFGNLIFSEEKSTCVVCSRISIDGDLVGDKDFDKDFWTPSNLNEYLKENNVPGSSESYLQAFTDSSVNSYPSVIEDDEFENFLNGEDIKKLETEDRNGDGKPDTELAVVFMQIKQKELGDRFEKLGQYGFAAAGATFLTPLVGSIASKLILNPVILTNLALVAVAGSAYIVEDYYEGKIAAAGYCGDLVGDDEDAAGGCSVVQVMPYKFSYLQEVCGSIEGNL